MRTSQRHACPKPNRNATQIGSFVECKECGHTDKWSKLEQRVVMVQYQDKKSDPEDDWYYEYLCAWCFAIRDNFSLEVAMRAIHKSHHGWEQAHVAC